MNTSHESQIAAAITKDSRGDRIFAYVLLLVVSLVALVVGYVLWGLISSLSLNMQSMSEDMRSMRKDISSMSTDIHSMSSDMHAINKELLNMSKSVHNMDVNTKGMQKDINDMGKLNPAKLF